MRWDLPLQLQLLHHSVCGITEARITALLVAFEAKESVHLLSCWNMYLQHCCDRILKPLGSFSLTDCLWVVSTYKCNEASKTNRMQFSRYCATGIQNPKGIPKPYSKAKTCLKASKQASPSHAGKKSHLNSVSSPEVKVHFPIKSLFSNWRKKA